MFLSVDIDVGTRGFDVTYIIDIWTEPRFRRRLRTHSAAMIIYTGEDGQYQVIAEASQLLPENYTQPQQTDMESSKKTKTSDSPSPSDKSGKADITSTTIPLYKLLPTNCILYLPTLGWCNSVFESHP